MSLLLGQNAFIELNENELTSFFRIMLSPLVSVPVTPSTCLGLDASAVTLSGNSPFNAEYFAKMLKAGVRLVLISSCLPEDHEATLERLAGFELPSHFVRFLPPIEEANRLCHYREELGWYRSYLWYKTVIAEQQGVTHYVDHEQQALDLFRRFLPKVECHYMWELCERVDTVHAPPITSPRKNVSETPRAMTDYPPYNPKIVHAGAQGMIQGVVCDLTTDPPTYTIG